MVGGRKNANQAVWQKGEAMVGRQKAQQTRKEKCACKGRKKVLFGKVQQHAAAHPGMLLRECPSLCGNGCLSRAWLMPVGCSF